MTQNEFKTILDKKQYSYHMDGDTIVVDYSGDVFLNPLTTLPENVEFNNDGSVRLPSLTSLPENVGFNNGGSVSLNSLKQISYKFLLKNERIRSELRGKNIYYKDGKEFVRTNAEIIFD